jgi:hypothetical protein
MFARNPLLVMTSCDPKEKFHGWIVFVMSEMTKSAASLDLPAQAQTILSAFIYT